MRHKQCLYTQRKTIALICMACNWREVLLSLWIFHAELPIEKTNSNFETGAEKYENENFANRIEVVLFVSHHKSTSPQCHTQIRLCVCVCVSAKLYLTYTKRSTKTPTTHTYTHKTYEAYTSNQWSAVRESEWMSDFTVSMSMIQYAHQKLWFHFLSYFINRSAHTAHSFKPL